MIHQEFHELRPQLETFECCTMKLSTRGKMTCGIWFPLHTRWHFRNPYTITKTKQLRKITDYKTTPDSIAISGSNDAISEYRNTYFHIVQYIYLGNKQMFDRTLFSFCIMNRVAPWRVKQRRFVKNVRYKWYSIKSKIYFSVFATNYFQFIKIAQLTLPIREVFYGKKIK